MLLVIALVGLLVASCANTPDSDQVVHCTQNSDCSIAQACNCGSCGSRSIASCSDEDCDGYGVGETSDCPLCVGEGRCGEDCNDSDEAINPGLLDICDGKDNDCDDEVDEAIPCENQIDCPNEAPLIVACEAGGCVYRTPVQVEAVCLLPIACVAGVREDRPDACF